MLKHINEQFKKFLKTELKKWNGYAGGWALVSAIDKDDVRKVMADSDHGCHFLDEGNKIPDECIEEIKGLNYDSEQSKVIFCDVYIE